MNKEILQICIVLLPLLGVLFSAKKFQAKFIYLDLILVLVDCVFYPSLNSIVSVLVIFISAIIHSYSLRYMQGDLNYRSYFNNLGYITSSILLFINTDDIRVLVAGLTISNLLLVNLMIHKEQWLAAKNSGISALKYLIAGSISLSFGLGILSASLNSYSINFIVNNYQHINQSLVFLACIFILLAIMIQSACIPFHKWLINSMNSPTPVSAIMHAGLVNCGGYILAIFSPLFLAQPNFLELIYIIGSISALVGTLFMLVQSDVKHKLGCSTIGQMGFMLMQCGLGLFSSAVSHMIMHGIFKATMFLSSGSALKEPNIDSALPDSDPVSWGNIFIGLIIGVINCYIFFRLNNFSLLPLDSRHIQTLFLAMLLIQLYLIISPISKIIAIFFVSLISLFYSLIVLTFEHILPSYMTMSQNISYIHIFISFIFWFIWLFSQKSNFVIPNRVYKLLLNASFSDINSSTTIRKNYVYKGTI